MSNKRINYKITAENKTQKAFAGVRKSVDGLAKVGAVAGAALGASMVAAYMVASKRIDKLAKTANASGFATENLASLQYQADLSGVSMESLNSSMIRFTKRMGEAEQGTGAANKMLDNMGLSTAEFFKLQPAEQYKIVSDRIAGMSTAQEKAAVSAAFFGREGIMMVNMLNEGSAGFAEAAAEAELFGLNISKLDASKIEAANDSMTRVKSIFQGVTNQIAIQFAPVVGALANLFVEATKSAGGVGPVVQSMAEKATKALGFLSDMGRGLNVVFLGLRQVVAEITNGLVQLVSVIGGFGAGIAEKLGFDVSGIRKIEEFGESFKATTEMMRSELQSKLLEPMPSSTIKTFVDDFQSKFDNEISANKSGGGLKLNPLGKDGNDDDNFLRKFERVSDRYATEEEMLRQSYTRRQGIIDEAKNREIISEDKWQALSTKNHNEYYDNLDSLSDAQSRANLAALSGTFGSIAGVMKEAKGEQSKSYRAMFAASQAFAAAEAGVKIAQGIASAWSLGWPAGIGAAAGVASNTAGLISSIKGQNMASFEGGGSTGNGIRAGGMDGKGGKLAMLHPNEKVTDMEKGGGGNNIVINNYSGEKVQALTRKDIIEIIVGENGDSTSRSRRALQSSSNVKARAS